MTRVEARALLNGGAEVDLDALDDVFSAFGFDSEFRVPDTMLFYHAAYIDCGIYTARDQPGRVLSPGQRRLVLSMLDCVEASERRQRR